MREIIKIGKRIYDTKNRRELHRLVVFAGRSVLHHSGVKELLQWFQADPVRAEILKKNAFPIEQATRAFFYAGSTFAERAKLLKEHFALLQERMQPEWIKKIETFHDYEIWRSQEEGLNWRVILAFEPGQRKEGLLSLEMKYGEPEVNLYQMMFWLARNKQGEPSLYIGAMQGPNADHAKELIKEATKLSFRYRTKNLILYMTQAVARSLGVQHIYAVSNQGYYAMNHMRKDRKLKTDFGAFWEEAGGRLAEDARFYELPLTEVRKTMEEVPTRKRAVYRKRFAFLDEADAEIAEKMSKILL